VPAAQDYQFRLRREEPGDPFSMDVLELAVALPSNAPADAAVLLEDAVKRAVGVTPRVVAVAAGDLVDPGRAWKARRFVDLRDHSEQRMTDE
jgi:hypothetical protein